MEYQQNEVVTMSLSRYENMKSSIKELSARVEQLESLIFIGHDYAKKPVVKFNEDVLEPIVKEKLEESEYGKEYQVKDRSDWFGVDMEYILEPKVPSDQELEDMNQDNITEHTVLEEVATDGKDETEF